MRRRTGGLLLVACLGTVHLTACTTDPGVVSTEARSGNAATESTSPPVDTTEPSTPSTTPSTGPVDTSPVGETTIPANSPEDDGIGDELFPPLGNPGIDVEHYTLVLDYDPKRRDRKSVV